MELTICVLVFQAYLIYICYRHFGMAPFPSMLVIYLSASQLVYGLVHDGFASNEMLSLYETGGLQNQFGFTQLFYSGVSTYVTFSSVCFRVRSSAVSEKISIGRLRRVISRGHCAVLLILLAIQLWILVAFAHWDIIIENHEYLSMTNPTAVMGDSSFLQGLFGSIAFVGPLSAAMAAFNYSMKRMLLFTAFAIISASYFLFLLSAHSRSAALEPAAFAAVLAMTGAGRHLLGVTFATALALFSILSGLAGRGDGAQGIVSLADTFGNIIQRDNSFISIMTNICEGIFVTGEGFQIDASHPILYKILSLSPAPSFLDNFSAINDVQQIRLHEYVPMSGFTEFYLFGILFDTLIIAIVTFAIYLYMKIRNINSTIFMICSILLFLCFYLLTAYPIRSAFKPLWLVYLLVSLVAPGMFRKPGSVRSRKQNIYGRRPYREAALGEPNPRIGPVDFERI